MDDFTAQVEEFIAHLTDAKLEPGAGPVRVLAENAPTAEELAEDSVISLHGKTWENIQRMTQKLNGEPPRPL